MQKVDISQAYVTKIDPDIASIYANESCTHCCGRGFYILQTGVRTTTVRKDRPIVDNYHYCDCARKNMKTYG